MSEPFTRPTFKDFVKQKWGIIFYDQVDRKTLSTKLQKKYGWSSKETDVQIDKAVKEFESR